METGKQGKTGDPSLIHSKIECVSCREEGTFPAIIYDVSGESVCLVTDHELNPDEIVSIRTSQEARKKDIAARIDNSRAAVKWSKPVERKDRKLYLTGLSLPHAGKAPEKDLDACQVCGAATGEEDACSAEGFSWLCPHCNEAINQLPSKLEEIVDTYLSGNPL